MTIQTLTILGATGSIGESTLDVIARHPDRYRIHALVAGSRVDPMLARIRQFKPAVAVLTDKSAALALAKLVHAAGLPTRVEGGDQAAIDVSREADTIVAGIVGAAGLAPTLAAAQAGKRILLANKEALVMAGQLFIQTCKQFGATVLPLDSEHNAIFQCLPTRVSDHPSIHAIAKALVPSLLEGVRHITLTASGGPFRTWTTEQMAKVTPAQAVAHPNWVMGRKISVDSATLMNKGLELIEACLLFGMDAEQVRVVVHPQSIIHSMVQYVDGSLLAQLGQPDMRTPIANALAWPARIDAGVDSLDLCHVARLEFEAPDEARFACLKLARDAFLAGPAAPCVLNASNEVAVASFLDEGLPFLEIANTNSLVLERLGANRAPTTIDEVVDLDKEARSLARAVIKGAHFNASQRAG